MNTSSSISGKHPLKNLKVTDGLLINSEHWEIAHEYHRQRQNIHYSSLNQKGIVEGLGVRVVLENNNFVLRVAPGIAIDPDGECIILSKERNFQISNQREKNERKTIYVVISHLRSPKNEDHCIQEDLFIDESDEPIKHEEVELCRINLEADDKGKLIIQDPQDVFKPKPNELNFLHRSQAKFRPYSVVRTAVYQPKKSDFLQSLPSLNTLYPGLWADVTPENQLTSERLSGYDLIYLTGDEFKNLDSQKIPDLQDYLKKGGVLLIEDTSVAEDFGKLVQVKYDLHRMISDIEESSNQDELDKITQELNDVTNLLDQQIKAISEPYNQKIATNLHPIEPSSKHPLWTEPFLFKIPPRIKHKSIAILINDGIILIIGNLSETWGLDTKLTLDRETIRSTQELGINILHFAYRRSYLTKLTH